MKSLTLEVLGHALRAAAGETHNILVAASPQLNIFSTADCAFAIFTREGKMSAHGNNISLLSGVLPSFVSAVLKIHPLHTLSPGDLIITNDPYCYGSQLTDIFALSPVYFNSRPLALVASAFRHSDVGGAVPGSRPTLSGEIFQEGIRIPPVKIYKKYSPNKELLSFFSYNARTGENFAKSVKAQLWAAQAAEMKLCRLAQKYGFEAIRTGLLDTIDRCACQVAAAIQQLPTDQFSFVGSAGKNTDSGGNLVIKASLKKCGGSLTVDFTGTHRQVAAPVNSALGTTLSCVYSAVRSALIPGLPLNDGLFRSIEIDTPPESLVNPSFPAPVSCSLVGAARGVRDAVSGALAGISTGIQPAAEGSVFYTVGGFDPNGGGYYSFRDTAAGGQNARPREDGENSGFSGMFTSNAASVEHLESLCPVLVNKAKLLEDSGGAGMFRGGLGVDLTFTVLGSTTVSAAAVTGGPPEGGSGGLAGSTANIAAGQAGQVLRTVPSGKYTGTPGNGVLFSLRTAGGRGYGSPLHRDPASVRDDVLEEFISPGTARDIYGVMLSGGKLEVDINATAHLRRKLSTENL